MPFNILLLPLLGGFLFIRFFLPFHYISQRLEGYRLIIWSSIAGTILVIIAHLLTFLGSRLLPQFHWWWQATIPFQYSGTAALSFFLGLASPHLLNLYYRDRTRHNELVRLIVGRHADDLETLFHRALIEKRQVSVTLRNDKVYIGWIVSLFDPSQPMKHVKIVPIKSGYRDANTRTLELTTDYLGVYNEMITESPEDKIIPLTDFEVVIPIGEVVSARLFEGGVYDRFLRLVTSRPKNEDKG